MNDSPANRNTSDFIDVIKRGDDTRLDELLHVSAPNQDRFSATITNPQPTNHAIGYGMTLLQFASYRSWSGGNPAAVLIAHGATVDLHSACGLGMTQRIQELLAADAKALDDQIDTYVPMQFAISAARPAAIQCLLDHGDDANRDLKKVAYFGWEDETLDQGYTPWKPIHMASLYGFDATRIPVAASLAARGADLNAISPLDGFRPIHLVAMPNRVDMIRFLVSQGVDIDSRTAVCNDIELTSDSPGPVNGRNCTPLMVAAAEGFAEATACLLELGADRNAENDQSQTALDFATRRFWEGQPYDEVIRLLAQP